ncbi:MAG: hypothetical protein QOK49_4548 [Baekduia sp.]|nr:hypothetical protein [Baekduia sp.]
MLGIVSAVEDENPSRTAGGLASASRRRAFMERGVRGCELARRVSFAPWSACASDDIRKPAVSPSDSRGGRRSVQAGCTELKRGLRSHRAQSQVTHEDDRRALAHRRADLRPGPRRATATHPDRSRGIGDVQLDRCSPSLLGPRRTALRPIVLRRAAPRSLRIDHLPARPPLDSLRRLLAVERTKRTRIPSGHRELARHRARDALATKPITSLPPRRIGHFRLARLGPRLTSYHLTRKATAGAGCRRLMPARLRS